MLRKLFPMLRVSWVNHITMIARYFTQMLLLSFLRRLLLLQGSFQGTQESSKIDWGETPSSQSGIAPDSTHKT
ncbi:MAG: hypothetical protein CM15mP49_19910 [Actinomycetota bacterium]|nr:MAG: hypothetical protein CM15mP49_19910 [Actinomycetota bacterium]